MILGPRIFSTGTILYGATTPFTVEIDSLDDALSHLRRMKASGAWSVKSYNQPRREQRQMIIEAARQLGMEVVPEGGSLFEMNMTMIADGHTTIEHSLPVPNIYDDVLQFWKGSEHRLHADPDRRLRRRRSARITGTSTPRSGTSRSCRNGSRGR